MGNEICEKELHSCFEPWNTRLRSLLHLKFLICSQELDPSSTRHDLVQFSDDLTISKIINHILHPSKAQTFMLWMKLFIKCISMIGTMKPSESLSTHLLSSEILKTMIVLHSAVSHHAFIERATDGKQQLISHRKINFTKMQSRQQHNQRTLILLRNFCASSLLVFSLNILQRQHLSAMTY